jgi:hypothetical protein
LLREGLSVRSQIDAREKNVKFKPNIARFR